MYMFYKCCSYCKLLINNNDDKREKLDLYNTYCSEPAQRLMCLRIVECTRVCHHVDTEISIDQLSRKRSQVYVEASTCLIVYGSEAELVPGVMVVRHARRR